MTTISARPRRIETPDLPQPNRFAEPLSVAAIHLLALSLFLAPAGVAAGLALLWLGLLLDMGRWRSYPGHALVWLALTFALYVPAQTLALGLWPTGGPPPDASAAFDWARLMALIPAAYAIGGDRARLWRLLQLALVGLVLGMFWRLDWALLLSDPAEFFDRRNGFGFGAIAFGLYSASALLGLILLRRWLWGATGRIHWGRVLGWSIAAALLLQGLLMSKARGAWLALLVALPVGLWLARRRPRGSEPTANDAGADAHGQQRVPRRIAIVLVAAALAALVLANAGRIGERLADERGITTALVSGEVAPDPHSSLSLRWHAQRFGLALAAERPWLGWGAGTTRALMALRAEPGVQTPSGRPLQHLHNSYLEAAVQLGLVGLGLFLALQLGLLAALWRRLRASNGRERDLAAALFAALLLLLVWDLFDFRALNQDWRGFWTFLGGAALAVVLFPAARDRDPAGPYRILLIRLSAIGDIVFATPLIAAFRRAYPQAHLVWLAQDAYCDLLRGQPGLDQVIPWPYGTIRALARQGRWPTLLVRLAGLAAMLRRERFDLVVDLQGLLKSALPAWLTGAPRRIGLGGREGGRLLLTEIVPRDRAAADPRIGSEYRFLAESMGLPLDGFQMRLVIPQAASEAAAALIADQGLADGYLVICPFTTRPQKHWPAERWPRLAQRLRAELGLAVVMLGGPADRDAAAAIADTADGAIVDLVGRTSLLEAGAMIQRSRLLIGVDTGLSHMGIALERPTLLLFGSTRPYLDSGRTDARVLYHPMDCSPCRRRPTCDGAFDCMAAIDIDEIIAALAMLPGAPRPIGSSR
jgi:heptosyltransferase-1